MRLRSWLVNLTEPMSDNREKALQGGAGMMTSGAVPAIAIVDPERMNLLGLLLSSLLARRLADPKAARHARALRGDVHIEASGMQVTLRFEPSRIEITRTPSTEPRVRVAGTLTALLGAALGRDRVKSVLRGELRVWGSPLGLWHILSLVRA